MIGLNQSARVLIIKTSSLGDVIHALPALTDASYQLTNVTFDWLVEESFSDIPAAHPAINRVIRVALRRWRRAPVETLLGKELGLLRSNLREYSYDLVIDAQGLVKSAILASLVPAPVTGLDKQSLREPLARFFYDNTVAVPRNLHAVERVRRLFAEALGYPLPSALPNYGLCKDRLQPENRQQISKQIIFLHGTTWPSKHWPERNWIELAKTIGASGYQIVIPWSTDAERERAMRIAATLDFARVLPRLELAELMAIMSNAAGAFCVDTGLGHLAAALGVPTMALYGPTNPALTGNYGAMQLHYQDRELSCVPCLSKKCPLISKDVPTQPCFDHDNVESLWISLQETMRKVGTGEADDN